MRGQGSGSKPNIVLAFRVAGHLAKYGCAECPQICFDAVYLDGVRRFFHGSDRAASDRPVFVGVARDLPRPTSFSKRQARSNATACHLLLECADIQTSPASPHGKHRRSEAETTHIVVPCSVVRPESCPRVTVSQVVQRVATRTLLRYDENTGSTLEEKTIGPLALSSLLSQLRRAEERKTSKPSCCCGGPGWPRRGGPTPNFFIFLRPAVSIAKS